MHRRSLQSAPRRNHIPQRTLVKPQTGDGSQFRERDVKIGKRTREQAGSVLRRQQQCNEPRELILESRRIQIPLYAGSIVTVNTLRERLHGTIEELKQVGSAEHAFSLYRLKQLRDLMKSCRECQSCVSCGLSKGQQKQECLKTPPAR